MTLKFRAKQLRAELLINDCDCEPREPEGGRRTRVDRRAPWFSRFSFSCFSWFSRSPGDRDRPALAVPRQLHARGAGSSPARGARELNFFLFCRAQPRGSSALCDGSSNTDDGRSQCTSFVASRTIDAVKSTISLSPCWNLNPNLIPTLTPDLN